MNQVQQKSGILLAPEGMSQELIKRLCIKFGLEDFGALATTVNNSLELLGYLGESSEDVIVVSTVDLPMQRGDLYRGGGFMVAETARKQGCKSRFVFIDDGTAHELLLEYACREGFEIVKLEQAAA